MHFGAYAEISDEAYPYATQIFEAPNPEYFSIQKYFCQDIIHDYAAAPVYGYKCKLIFANSRFIPAGLIPVISLNTLEKWDCELKSSLSAVSLTVYPLCNNSAAFRIFRTIKYL